MRECKIKVKMTESGSNTNVTENNLKTNLSNMTMVQLKEELKRRRLKTMGLKNELILRLLPFMQLEREHGQAEQHDDQKQDDDEDDSENDSLGNEDEPVPERRRSRGSQPLTIRDVEESLETFNGDDKVDIKKWISDFEEMAELCEWSDIQNIIYAKRLLRGSAKLFVNYGKCLKPWRKLRRPLIEEFADVVDSHAVNQELARRKKTSNESYQAYIYKMLEIAAQAEVDTRSVIQYIIEGIQDDPVSKTNCMGRKQYMS